MSKANDVTESEFATLSRLFKKGTSTQLEGERKRHEGIAGSTSTQMIMAGVFKDATPDEYNKAPPFIHLETYIKEQNIPVIPPNSVYAKEKKETEEERRREREALVLPPPAANEVTAPPSIGEKVMVDVANLEEPNDTAFLNDTVVRVLEIAAQPVAPNWKPFIVTRRARANPQRTDSPTFRPTVDGPAAAPPGDYAAPPYAFLVGVAVEGQEVPAFFVRWPDASKVLKIQTGFHVIEPPPSSKPAAKKQRTESAADSPTANMIQATQPPNPIIMGKSSLNRITEVKKMQYFKKFYSWFSGVKIHRTTVGQTTSMSDENEDEHVIPFGFMLLFGGGLARIINKDNYNEEIKVIRSSTKWTDASEDFIEWLVAYDNITESGSGLDRAKRSFNMFNIKNTTGDTDIVSREDRVDVIKKYGLDLGEMLWLYNDKDARLILDCLGYKTEMEKAEFCKNMFNINYYGYYLSEGKANSVKSDHLFIKLEKENNSIKFSPSIHRVQEFNNELFAWANCFDKIKCEELDSEIRNRTKKDKEGDDNIIYKEPGLSSKWIPKGVRMLSGYCTDTNKDIGKENMLHILEILCHYLNKDILHRIIFNIIMTRTYLHKKAKSVPLGKVSGPPPDETKNKLQLIEKYDKWLNKILDTLDNNTDEQLINQINSERTFLNSDETDSMIKKQIESRILFFYESIKTQNTSIPDLNFPIQATAQTAEGFADLGTKIAEVSTPLGKIPAISKDGRPTVPRTSHTHLSDSSNVPAEKFELEFFNAYLEERPDIRANLEQLGGNEHHNGLVFQALIELDNKFFNKVNPPERVNPRRRAAANARQRAKNESSASSDDDEVFPIALGAKGPGSSKAVGQEKLFDSQESTGWTGGRKTRKRKQKRLFRRGGPQR